MKIYNLRRKVYWLFVCFTIIVAGFVASLFLVEGANYFKQPNLVLLSPKVSDGFDYPIGPTGNATQANDGDGWYNFQDFTANNHLGEDWNAESGGNTDCGAPVYASSSGTIMYASSASGWGRVLIIRHQLPDGTRVETLYGHLQSFVRTTGEVSRRELIGTIGDGSGTQAFCHLHFELRFSNSPNWGTPGCGYLSSNPNCSSTYTGWTDPSNYVDAHRTLQSCNNGTSTLRNRDGGPPIHPPGSVIKTASSGTVYLIDSDNRKRPITSSSVLAQLYNQSTDARTSTNFTNWVITVGQDELDLYEQGGNISAALSGNGQPFPDGKLISYNGQVSIVTGGGKRRPFTDGNRFTGLGYNFCQVVNVSQTEYNSYPTGPPVDAMPLLTSSLNINPTGPYTVGQNITGSFTLKNVGYDSISFASLGAGGRLNGTTVYDMNFVSTTLAAGSSYSYTSQNRQLNSSGTYDFFAAYQENNGHWAVSVPAAPGVTRSRQIQVGNTSCPSPTAITVGQTRNGSLQSGDCLREGKFYDAYTFSGTAGQQIYITMSAQFDTFLYLYRGSYPGGTLSTQDDDGGDGTNSRIPADSGFFTLPSTGTYTILASSYAANVTGNYTLFLGSGQPPNCSYLISPTSQSFNSNGGNGTVNVTVNSGCAWTATSNTSWLTVTSGNNGSGNGTVGYSVSQNTASTQRQGTITIAGQIFTVTQSGVTGCSSPLPITFGQTRSGNLQSGDCLINGRFYDAYTFSGTARQKIYIRLDSTQIDSYLYLYRGNYPGGTLWSSNDDGGGLRWFN